jgi:hypothetical protein
MNIKSFNLTSSQEVKAARNDIENADSTGLNNQEGKILFLGTRKDLGNRIRVEMGISRAEIVGLGQLHPKTQGNLRSKSHAKRKIKLLMNIGFDNTRFQRGYDILNKKNQIVELDRSRFRVRSQSNCGEYEVISTEQGWICSCPDHRFRNINCKHIFAIFSIQNTEREAGVQDRMELTHTYCDRSIAGNEYSETSEEFEAGTINETREPTVEANQQLIPLTKEKGVNQNLLIQMTGYEQELYEKDHYIQELENEIRGLKASNHPMIKGGNL